MARSQIFDIADYIMAAPPSRDYLPQLLAIAKTAGLLAPGVYAGITYCYSNVAIPPLLTHAPPKLLAKQWLQAYQLGPRWVPPLILGGTLSNALLAYFSTSRPARRLYILAGLWIWSIMPYTLFYMEPGINGAGKWKIQSTLKDEGMDMEENEGWTPDVTKHTATPSARTWAEAKDMKHIVQAWSDINTWRWVVVGAAVVASGAASNWPWT